MRCARNSRNSWVVLALALMLLFSACTIVPKPVRDARASFDGNTANSGFLQFNADGSGRITPHARERYNGLVKLYGAHFTPPLAANAGLVENRDGTFTMDAEHLVKFATMNRWHKEGK